MKLIVDGSRNEWCTRSSSFKVPHDRRELGQRGEAIALVYLEERGFEIIGRNLWRKSGELDIVALESDRLVFVEVRTLRGGAVRPEDLHPGPTRQRCLPAEAVTAHRTLQASGQWRHRGSGSSSSTAWRR